MDKYEQLSVVGEGSYGIVLKCRRRDTGQLVAIKKFLETEDDAAVRKMALREIRMLKKLRHEHLVNLIEVFRRKRRFYLVLEYLEYTLLDQLEATPHGLGETTARAYLYQLLKALAHCHRNSIIHRDVKPENVLVSSAGVLKLCDLGFARALASPGEPYTEYVATRWYRAPELLVADHRYGAEVDIWAAGCLFAEMLTGEPLFPGDSDIDQLNLIISTVGKLAPRHQQVVSRLARGATRTPSMMGAGRSAGVTGSLPGAGAARELLAACLRTEPRARPAAAALLKHKYFTADGFADSFNEHLMKLLGKQVPGEGRSRASSAMGESLIDYNYAPSVEAVMDAVQTERKQHNSHFSEGGDENSSVGLPPAAPHMLKTPSKAHHEAFRPLPVPEKSYQRTPCIKKITKTYLNEDLGRGRSRTKPTVKLPCDLSLPYVSGASNSPMKKAKKPHQKTYDWDRIHHGVADPLSARSPTTLPYM